VSTTFGGRHRFSAWDARCAAASARYRRELDALGISPDDALVYIRWRLATADWTPLVAFFSEAP
jgi:hypothetical protein